MWAAGVSGRDIARAVGMTPGSLSVYLFRQRARGYDLPHRYAGSADGCCQGCGASLPVPARKTRPRKWCHTCRPTGGTAIRQCTDCTKPVGKGRHHWRCPSCNRRLVEQLWVQGETAHEIAAVAGWRTKNPASYIRTLRCRGYDLPQRRHSG